MANSKSAEQTAQEWYEKYREMHTPPLEDSNYFYPIWQMLALAAEIHDKNGPYDHPNEVEYKIERISIIGNNLRQRKNRVFPSQIVTEIEEAALEFARTRKLPTFNP